MPERAHLKNLKSSVLWRDRIFPSNGHYINWAFPTLRFTVGRITIKLADRKVWKTNHLGHPESGTVSLMTSAGGSLTWHWMCRSYLPGNWRCASLTQKSTLSQRLQSITCSNPLIWLPALHSLPLKRLMSSGTRPGDQSVVADRLHLPEGHRLGLDESVDHP